MKKAISMLMCLLMVLATLTGCSQSNTGAETQESQVITLRIGCGQPESAPMVQYVDTYFCEEISKRVAESTNYEIEWMKGWGGSMVTLGEALEGTEAGIVDIGVVVIPMEPSKLKIWNMFYYMPFAAFDSTKAIDTLMETIDTYSEFTDVFAEYNTKYLGIGFSEPYGMFSSYEINDIGDLTGEKVGAAGANLTWVDSPGVAGVTSSLPDMYTSIQTGVYKIGIQPSAMAINVQAYDVAPYILEGFSSLPCDLVIMNQDSFDGLPAEVQDIVVAVGEDYTATDPEYVMNAYELALDVAIENGASVYTLSEEEKIEWINAIPDTISTFADELEVLGIPGSEIIDFYYSGIEAGGAEPITK